MKSAVLHFAQVAHAAGKARTATTPASSPEDPRHPPRLLARARFTKLVSLMRPHLTTLAIVALFLAVRVAFFVGYANVDPWDDSTYLALAQKIRAGGFLAKLDALARWNGSPVPPQVLAILRPAYLFPLALFQSIGGAGEEVSALPSLLGSLGVLGVVLALGGSVADRPTALVAGLLYAVVPLDVSYSTRILPESLQAFWIALAVLAAQRAVAAPSTRRRNALLVFSGLALFLGYLTRAQALLGLPVALLATRPLWRLSPHPGLYRWAPCLIVVTLTSGIGAESAFHYSRTGHPFLNSQIQSASVQSIFLSKPEALFHPVPGLVVHSSYEFGGPHHLFKQWLGQVEHYPGVHLFSAFVPLGALALGYAVFRRQHGFLVLWLLGFVLAVQYGFADLRWDAPMRSLHYYLHFPAPRYLESAMVPLVLLAASLILAIARRSRAAAVAIVIAVAVTALHHASRNYDFYRGSLKDMREVARFLETEAEATAFIDSWGALELRLLRQKPPALAPLPPQLELPQGSLIVLGGSRGYDLASRAVAEGLPAPWRELYSRPELAPQNWKTVFRRAGPHHVARVSDVIVFRVEAR